MQLRRVVGVASTVTLGHGHVVAGAIRKMDPRPIYFRFWCLMINTTKLD